MNDAQLRDLMTSAYEAVPPAPSPLDPDADLGRGRTARGRRRARRAGAGAALAVAALAAGAALIQPGAGAARVPATPGPTPMVSATGVDGSAFRAELEQRMERALREHLFDADTYLGTAVLPAEDEDDITENVAIRRTWGRPDEAESARILHLVSTAAPPDGVTWPVDQGWMCSTLVGPGGKCWLSDSGQDVGIFLAQDEGLPKAYALYADGRSVEISVEPANPHTDAVGAPLPTLTALSAVVSDPGLAWPASRRADDADPPSSTTKGTATRVARDAVTPTEYGRRMEAALHEHFVDGDAYLAPWAPPTGEVFAWGTTGDGQESVDSFGIRLNWSGESPTDGVVRVELQVSPPEFGPAGPGLQTDETQCEYIVPEGMECARVAEDLGTRIYYGKEGPAAVGPEGLPFEPEPGTTSGNQVAAAVYPDGTTVRVSVFSLTPPDAPFRLPTQKELVAVVMDPAVQLPETVAGPHPFFPERGLLEQMQYEMGRLTGDG